MTASAPADLIASPSRVLVVDDDDAMRELLVQVLSDAGHDAWGVGDAATMLATLESGSVDAVITDFWMPGRTGLEVLAEARRRGVRVAFVVLSAFADDDVRRAAMAVGATAVLAKPLVLDDLLQAVRSALG